MKLVSIIIPMYNSESFIFNTLELISKQTYPNFEVIIVDDCSRDNCYKLCKEFTLTHSGFHLYQNEENKGICYTRNYGLSLAKGDYIVFCDDDDEITPDLISDNISLLEKYDASFVKFGRSLIDVDKDGNIVSETSSKITNELIFENHELIDDFFEIKKTGVLINVWNGIYRKEIIEKNNLCFDTAMKFGSEDAKFSLEYLLASKKLVINPNNYYIHYRRVNSSTSKQFNMNKINSLVETAKTESLIWDRIHNEIEVICAKNAYVINIIVLQLLNENCPYSRKEKIQIIKKVSKENHLQYSLNSKLLIGLLKKSRKQFVFSILMKLKCYAMVLRILSKYSIN